MKYLLSLIFVVLLALSCTPVRHTTTQILTDDGEIEFVFLHLNDVYEIAPLENGQTGGLARVATLNNELKEENRNTLTLLAGDFLSPSLLGTLKKNGEKIAGAQMVEAMNIAGFDLVTFGNHEFDLSEKNLQQRINQSDFDWISSNVLQRSQDSQLNRFYKIKKAQKKYIPDHKIWEIKDSDGTTASIGIFGITLPTFVRPYVSYEDFYLEARKAYQHLSSQCDLVIGITHLERTQDSLLAAMLPEVPLLMGGHDHVNMYFEVGPVKVAKADANAKTAYIHRFKLNKFFKTHTLESTLVSLDTSIRLEPNTDAVVQKWQSEMISLIKKTVDKPNEIIYTTTTSLEGREAYVRNGQTNLGTIITAAMHRYAPAPVQAAMFNSGGIRLDDRLRGNLTPVDIFRTLPFGGKVFTVEMTGELLNKILNTNKARAGKGAYLQLYNLKFIKDKNQWEINGNAVQADKNYFVALNDFLLKGMDIPFLDRNTEGIIQVIEPQQDMPAHDIRKAIVEYLKSKP